MTALPIQKNASQLLLTQLPKSNPLKTNYIFLIQNLVDRIFLQLNRFSEQSKRQSDSLKISYNKNSIKAADLQKKIGTLAPMFTGAVLAGGLLHAGLSSFISENAFPVLKQIPTLIEHTVSMVKDPYVSRVQADQMRTQSKSSLENTELANEGQKSGDNLQQELLSLLSSLRETLRRVSA